MKKLIILLITVLVTFTSYSQDDNSKIISEIDSIMQQHYTSNKPGASIIVYKDRAPLFKQSYGMANLEESEAITTETVFRIGSITKQFTAIGIMMLIEEGKLSLDDTVSKYYPDEFSNKSPITIKHLLSHTSGIKDLSRIRAIRPLMSVNSKPETIIKIISDEDLNFNPGTKYDYSNSGYVVLGGILEKVSGQSYKRFLTTRIFEPLGMRKTHYANKQEITDKVALGYFTRNESFANAPDINSSLLFAAGGIWSNPKDMALWNEALYENKLVDQKYIRMVFKPNILNNGEVTDYGFGFRACKVNDIESIEHGGGVFGYSSYGIRIERFGVYVLILTNFERNNSYDDVAAKIAAIAINKPYDYSNYKTNINIKDGEKYIGVYKTNEGDTLLISIKENTLVLSRGNKENKLKQIKENVFLIDGTLDDRLTFTMRKVNALYIKRRRSMEIMATKID